MSGLSYNHANHTVKAALVCGASEEANASFNFEAVEGSASYAAR